MKQLILVLMALSICPGLSDCSGGRACAPGELRPPEPRYPAADMVIGELKPPYSWDKSGIPCEPEGYLLVVSEKEDLSDPKIHLREFNPATTWQPDIELENCTAYYWEMASILGDQDGAFSAVSHFHTDAGGICGPPPCAKADSSQPILTAPVPDSITSTTPDLTWQYPPACEPDTFVIQLSTWFDFVDPSLIQEGNSTGMLWSPPSPLANATMYYWRVADKIDGTIGPFSEVSWFFTGPECTSETVLVAPDLIRPEHGATFSEKQIYMQWRPGALGCIPDGYYRDLQTASDFSGLNLMLGIYNKPGTSSLSPGLQDCTRYYLRIAAIQDGVRGPYSQPRAFRIDLSGDCMVPLPLGEVLQNVNCREGPHVYFGVVRILMQGELVELIGRNRSMTSFLVRLPDQTTSCWSALDFIRPSIDPQDLPIVPEPEIPCREDLSEDECLLAGGEWTLTTGMADSYHCECP